MVLPKTTQNQMRRRICRSVIGQFGFRSVRAVVTVVALSHERLTLSAAKLKKKVHLECSILASRARSEFGGFGGSYLLKTYPSTTRRFTYFATPIQVLRLTFSCRVPLGIGAVEALVDTRVPLWVIPYSQTSISDHLSLATTSYKRPVIQKHQYFPRQNPMIKPLVKFDLL